MVPVRVAKAQRLLVACLVFTACYGEDLVIERPVRTWEFVDATGPRAAWLGHEDGTFEAYVWPLKVLKDFRLSFRIGSHVIPAAAIARSIEARPGSYTIRYSADEFAVAQTVAASPIEPGVVMRIRVRSSEPVEVLADFTRDFQLMWPASIGSAYVSWDTAERLWTFGADGHPFAAVLGSPSARLVSSEYATNYSASVESTMSLGSVNGAGEIDLALAGSVKSREEALAAYRRLMANPGAAIDAAEAVYREYLDSTVRISVPDPMIQRAYDWARVATVKGMVDNPLLGRGLVAGYGPSKGLYRPGFAWFFGRDSFWTSLALTVAGDHKSARDAIDFIAQFQREDGKIPHEISQSASLISWWKDYPYGYASADATPLYAIAVRDYVDASGDVSFARKHWPRLMKALAFMRATREQAGFPKNYEVGHGWVEGGPLLPVRVEFYQAGCYVEALRSLSKLARAIGDASAASLEQEFEERRKALDAAFWLPESKTYAFALGLDSKPVDQTSVLATVPMWFDVADPDHSRAMIQQLARADHATDWGMRIISERSPQFGPAGYHFGSVWPLFTGWASVGEYRQHMPQPAFANLRANAWLTLDGAGGVTTEVLSGASYSPLSTSSPHQIWSSAMVVSSVLRGLFGLRVDATAHRVTLEPHFPADWQRASCSGVRAGNSRLDFAITRDASGLALEIRNQGDVPVSVEFSPAEPDLAAVTAAQVNGRAVKWQERRNGSDWHAVVVIDAGPGVSTARIDDRNWFGYAVPYEPPSLGSTSSNLKVIGEKWSGRELEITFSGRGRQNYIVRLSGTHPTLAAGGQLAWPNLLLAMPPGGAAGEYTTRTVRLRFAAPE